MYINLLGQKAYYHLTDDDMGKIIGISKNVYNQRCKTANFGQVNVRRFVCILINLLIIYLQQKEKKFLIHAGEVT